MKKIFIIGTPRSGTTQLARILSRHQVYKYKYCSEFILRYIKENNIESECELKEKIEYLFGNFDIIKEIFVEPTDLQKVKYFEFSRKYIFEKDIVILRVFRKNKLKQALSAGIATQTNCWHSYSKNSVLEKISVSCIEKRIEHLIYLEEKMNSELSEKDNIRILYEDFYFSREKFLNTLNVIFQASQISLKFKKPEMINLVTNGKINCKKTYEMIPNIEEIKLKLSNEKNGFLD